MSNNKIDVSCFQIMEILCRENVIHIAAIVYGFLDFIAYYIHNRCIYMFIPMRI